MSRSLEFGTKEQVAIGLIDLPNPIYPYA